MVARLYLVKYQLEAGQIDQASRTLEKCFALGRDNRFLHVNVLNCPRKYKAEDYHNAFFFLCQRILDKQPNQWQFYFDCATLFSHPYDQSYLLLKGACHAFEEKEYQAANALCTRAKQIGLHSFVDDLVSFHMVTSFDLESKLAALDTAYTQKGDLKSLAKLHKMAKSLFPQAFLYQCKFVDIQIQRHRWQKIAQPTMDWLDQLISNNQLQYAEKVIAIVGPAIDGNALLSQRLQEALNKFAKTLVEQKKFETAEKAYRYAFQKFPTFEQAILLANTLYHQGNKLAETFEVLGQACDIARQTGAGAKLTQTLEWISCLSISNKL